MSLNIVLDEAKTIDELKGINLNVIILISRNGREIDYPSDSCIATNVKYEDLENVIMNDISSIDDNLVDKVVYLIEKPTADDVDFITILASVEFNLVGNGFIQGNEKDLNINNLITVDTDNGNGTYELEFVLYNQSIFIEVEQDELKETVHDELSFDDEAVINNIVREYSYLAKVYYYKF